MTLRGAVHGLTSLALAVVVTVSAAAAQTSEDITLEGGDTSVSDATREAYLHALPNLNDASQIENHDWGHTGFLRDFSKVPIAGRLRIGK